MSVTINAVATSFAVIEHMAAAGTPLGVSEVARMLNAGKPLVFRHLRTLVELGYVAQDPGTDRYSLTPRLFHIGRAIADSVDLLSAARRVMPELAEAVKLSVSVSQVEQDGIRILDILEYRSAIEISTPPGSLFDFLTSAQGKVAMAFSPALLEGQVGARTQLQTADGKMIDAARLRAELDRVRVQGWALSAQEVLLGVNALAAPVFDGLGALAGTIAVVGSTQTLPDDPPATMIEALVSASRKLSEQLGYRKGETKT
ncbi:IclR family transcriptional regulator [Sphingomonas flavalba]|uniref:IclR family transcriptional regulator n=1 Tax=Sphingomonas flavalba TaxID=2559804 RepID=UPI0039DF4A5F